MVVLYALIRSSDEIDLSDVQVVIETVANNIYSTLIFGKKSIIEKTIMNLM